MSTSVEMEPRSNSPVHVEEDKSKEESCPCLIPVKEKLDACSNRCSEAIDFVCAPLEPVLAPIRNYFDFEGSKTTFGSECIGGLTTFITMVYTMAVNPSILSNAVYIDKPGDLFAELVFATGMSAAITTLIMALVGKYPFALAPGQGSNAYFAFTVVLTLKFPWELALAAVFLEGAICTAFACTPVRQWIMEAIPDTLKSATGVGLGLFISYIGLSSAISTGGAGFIIKHPVTLTTFGTFVDYNTLLATFGILFVAFLLLRKVPGAIFIAMIVTSAIGWIADISPPPTAFARVPDAPSRLFGRCFVGFGKLTSANVADFISVTIILITVDIMDTSGTLTGVARRIGVADENGNIPRMRRATFADAIGCCIGAVFGTSTVTTFIESAAGVAAGARTGFASVITGLLFLLALFFIPIFAAIPGYATCLALFMTGVYMCGTARDIEWDDLSEAIPAFITIIVMPLGFSIGIGLQLGFISHAICRVFTGRWREVSPAVYVFSLLFIARFIFVGIRYRES